MLTASAATPASVSPLTFLAGIAAFVVLVAVIGGAARYLRAGHRAGMARLAAADFRGMDANRRARTARRTVVDLDESGRVAAVTVERRRRTV